MAGTKNLVIDQKATFQKRLTYKDKFKRPVNLTGYTAHMQIRASDGTVIADLTTENGGIALGGVTGTIDLLIDVAATSAMSFTSATYDLKLIQGGIHKRLIQGKVTLSLGVTE